MSVEFEFARHAPAPWHIEQGETSVHSHGNEYVADIPIVVDADGEEICIVSPQEKFNDKWEMYGFDTSRCEAVALMIEAIPDMVSLLKELRDDYVQNPNGVRKINELLTRIGEKADE